MRRYRTQPLVMILLAALAVACSDDGPMDPTTDPSIEPFIGRWDAEVILITSDADPNIVADLMVNGSFSINVEPSGIYTATLTFGGIPIVEIGQLSSQPGFVTLRPNGGDPATSSYSFRDADYVEIDGPTEFDFNLDEILDPAQLYMEWSRR